MVVVGAVAAFAAGLIAPRLAVPVVVLEIVLGIIVGPELLGLAKPDDFLEFFSSLGLGMLFFFAGYEIDFERIRGSPLKLAAIGRLISLALAYSLGGLLALTGSGAVALVHRVGPGHHRNRHAVPILSDAGELRTRFGGYLLAAGAMGEFGPILLITFVFSTQGAASNALILALFVLVGGGGGHRRRTRVGRHWACSSAPWKPAVIGHPVAGWSSSRWPPWPPRWASTSCSAFRGRRDRPDRAQGP